MTSSDERVNPPLSAEDAAKLEELVAAALERRALGAEPDVDELCADEPQLRDALADTLGLAGRLPATPSAGGGGDPMLGALLDGRYVVSECIGSGAMGIVYRGDDIELRRAVAIKVLRVEAQDDPERAERFLREGDALAALNHPAVVAVFDRGRTADGRVYLVMDYLAGVSLVELFEQGMDLRDAVQLTADLAAGLQAAHEAGVFHRDVKPSNVLMTNRGPVLVDFGIAAVADEETLARGTEGLGTPAYMAPEQLTAGHPAAATADVYGLTATLYHALTGTPPYRGSPAQVLAAIPRRAPDPAARRRPQLPRDLLAILDRGMAREPERRYPSAAALRDDLQAFLDYRPVTARYPGWVARQWRQARRSVAARTLLAVAVIGLVATGGWLWQAERARVAEARRDAGWRSTWPRIEPLLTLWNPADRVFEDAAYRDEVRALLDRAVAHRPGPLPALVVRAAFAFDHGDRRQAAEDLDTVAAELGTPIATALAAAYRDAVDDPTIDAVGGFDGLEARGVDDLYLQAFHEIRRGRYGDATRLLERPELADHSPSQELLLTIRIATLPADQVARTAAARQLYEAVVRMEERYGMRTAMTAHLTAGALLGQGRYAEAATMIGEGLELAPRSASLMSNLGIARMRLGDYPGAVEVLERAIALRPHSPHSHESLFWSLLRLAWLGRDDAPARARRVAEQAPLGAAGRSRLLGELEFDLLLRALQDSDRRTAAQHAAVALDHWRRAGVDEPFALGFATAVRDGGELFGAAAQLAAASPGEWWKLTTLLAVLPESIDADGVAALAALLRAQIRDRAPEVVTEFAPSAATGAPPQDESR